MAERGCDGSGRESRAGYVDNGGGGGGAMMGVEVKRYLPS